MLVLGVGDVPVITQIDGKEQDFLISGVLNVEEKRSSYFRLVPLRQKGTLHRQQMLLLQQQSTCAYRRKGQQDNV